MQMQECYLSTARGELSFGNHSDYRYDHLLHTHASVLKCIPVVIGKVIEIIGVTQILLLTRKNIT